MLYRILPGKVEIGDDDEVFVTVPAKTEKDAHDIVAKAKASGWEQFVKAKK